MKISSTASLSYKADILLGIRKKADKKLEKKKKQKAYAAKQKSLTSVQKSIWKLCKQLIREKYGNICYTCGKPGLAGSNWHTGHFIASSVCGAYLKYDLRNLRPQCYNCNINLGGNGAYFHRRLVELEGQEYVDELFADKNRITKADTHYRMLLASYQQMTEKVK